MDIMICIRMEQRYFKNGITQSLFNPICEIILKKIYFPSIGIVEIEPSITDRGTSLWKNSDMQINNELWQSLGSMVIAVIAQVMQIIIWSSQKVCFGV